MAPKKKKKPAANPARGFATTSVASKPKPDKKEDTPTEALENETGVATEVSESIQVQGDDPKAPRTTKDDHQVTPEELEAQLELDELQLLVEKHAAKVRRDASRQMTRIQTDRRVLRAQAQPLATRDWLSADLKDAMIDLAKLETGDLNQISGHQSFLKSMPEEEGTLKLWTLRQALTDLTFSPNRVEQALKWLCAHPVNADSAPYIWGLQECLEFLALECDEEQLLPYESALIPKTGVAASTENSRPGKFPSALTITHIFPFSRCTHAASW
jgi:ATP-dependent RNA helicase DHX29